MLVHGYMHADPHCTVHADDRNLVLDCVATDRQSQQDEVGRAGPRAGHSYG